MFACACECVCEWLCIETFVFVPLRNFIARKYSMHFVSVLFVCIMFFTFFSSKFDCVHLVWLLQCAVVCSGLDWMRSPHSIRRVNGIRIGKWKMLHAALDDIVEPTHFFSNLNSPRLSVCVRECGARFFKQSKISG